MLIIAVNIPIRVSKGEVPALASSHFPKNPKTNIGRAMINPNSKDRDTSSPFVNLFLSSLRCISNSYRGTKSYFAKLIITKKAPCEKLFSVPHLNFPILNHFVSMHQGVDRFENFTLGGFVVGGSHSFYSKTRHIKTAYVSGILFYNNLNFL